MSRCCTRSRAKVLYALMPYDKSVWCKLRSPLFLVLTLLLVFLGQCGKKLLVLPAQVLAVLRQHCGHLLEARRVVGERSMGALPSAKPLQRRRNVDVVVAAEDARPVGHKEGRQHF